MTINICEALHLVRDSWRCVNEETIRNCWHHTGILPSGDDDRSTMDIDEEERLIAEITKDADRLEIDNEHRMDVREWLSADKELETGESLTDEKILTIVSKPPAHENGDRNDAQSDDEDTDEPPWKTSAKDAKFAIDTLISYLEQHPDLQTLQNTWIQLGHCVTLWSHSVSRRQYSTRF